MLCRHCWTQSDPIIDWHRNADASLHLGAYCTKCSGFIQWVPQTERNLAKAPPKPEPTEHESFEQPSLL